MKYNNLIEAVDFLGKKLNTFAGHSIDAIHTSYCFDQIARSICYLKKEDSAKSVDFEGSIWVDGRTIPVVVNVESVDIDSNVNMSIRIAQTNQAEEAAAKPPRKER